jgi:uncharacterized protein YfiM (DUF2279 family)
MIRSIRTWIGCGCFLLILPLAGCDRAPPQASMLKMEGQAREEPAAFAAGAAVGNAVGTNETIAAKRHIEIRHDITLEVAASDIERLWLAQRDACKPPTCQLVSADYSEPEEDADSADVSMLIAANQADALIDGLRKLGRITRHDISQVDRTLQVVDLAARLANQRALRDRLRALAAQRADKLRDVLDLERELARVQGEIDSLDGQLRQVENVTRNVTLTLHFTKPASAMHESAWVPLQDAGTKVSMTFTRSVANLLLFAANVLPWLLAALPLVWLIGRRWRRRRGGRDIDADSK